ncbi:MAG TPA: phage portal protein [Phytomonospora sp.]|nr:phage portal protein [Streptomycetaceae bacterium]
MSFWRSLFGLPDKADEQRTIMNLPWSGDYAPFNAPTFPDATSSVSPQRALSLSSVYAANRLLAQSISTLPLKPYRRVGEDRQPMGSLPQLFAQLVADGQLVPWLHRCVTSLGLRGNAFGLITARDGFGFPIAITWLDPGLVQIDPRPGRNGWLWKGREVPLEDIVHIPLFAMPGERLGLSPIASFAQTLGVGLQAQTYASDWFAAGGFPPGTFRNEGREVEQAEADIIKARLVTSIRTHTPLVHGNDWKYEPISVPPNEAQFIETMKMTTNQIAAIYGIPPEMIGGESGSSMTYANVEQQQINFVMFTLRPWLVVLESAFSALLPDRQYVKFNSDALIRADLKTRWEVNQIRLNVGAANVDEIRAQEDQPPLPNGQGQQYGPTPAPTPEAPPANPTGVTPIRRVPS